MLEPPTLNGDTFPAVNKRASVLVPPLLSWFDRTARDLPWRRTKDPYAIWISEIMLQQTQVKTVIPYWERWMKQLPTVQSLARARMQTALKLWEGLGYYTRVRNAQKAAQIIVARHGGVFPRDHAAVLALPGIGRYTAGAICSIAFSQPAPILDGNVTRVLCRVFGIGDDPRERKVNERLWTLAQQLVQAAVSYNSPRLPGSLSQIRRTPTQQKETKKTKAVASFSSEKNQASHLNQSMMELGAVICTPRSPRCGVCPIQEHCAAFRLDKTEEWPAAAKRPASVQRRRIAFIVARAGKYLVQQRPTDAVNAGLWEFPGLEVDQRRDDLPRECDGFAINDPTPLCRVDHTITRYRIRLEAYHAETTTPKTPGRWLTPAELAKLPFTSAHRKIAECL